MRAQTRAFVVVFFVVLIPQHQVRAQDICQYCRAPEPGYCWYCSGCNQSAPPECVTNCTQPACEECDPGGTSCGGFASLTGAGSWAAVVGSSDSILILGGELFLAVGCSAARQEGARPSDRWYDRPLPEAGAETAALRLVEAADDERANEVVERRRGASRAGVTVVPVLLRHPPVGIGGRRP